MKTCPVCTTPLTAAARQGVEIDHCPRCRGVWLDRGELDKLIERSTRYAGPGRGDDDSDWGDDHRGYAAPPPQPGYPHPGHHPPGGYPHPGHPPQGGYPPPGQYPPKKKEGFFGRLFDFD